MKYTKFVIMLSLGVLFLISCEKKDETSPTITISSPADNTTLKKGSEFTISGVVTDDTQLKEIKIGDSFTITSFNSPKRHELNEKFTISANQPTGNVIIEISATDAEGNKASKTIPLVITD